MSTNKQSRQGTDSLYIYIYIIYIYIYIYIINIIKIFAALIQLQTSVRWFKDRAVKLRLSVLVHPSFPVPVLYSSQPSSRPESQPLLSDFSASVPPRRLGALARHRRVTTNLIRHLNDDLICQRCDDVGDRCDNYDAGHVTLTRARHGGTALTPDRDASTPVSSAIRGHVTCVWPMT